MEINGKQYAKETPCAIGVDGKVLNRNTFYFVLTQPAACDFVISGLEFYRVSIGKERDIRELVFLKNIEFSIEIDGKELCRWVWFKIPGEITLLPVLLKGIDVDLIARLTFNYTEESPFFEHTQIRIYFCGNLLQ